MNAQAYLELQKKQQKELSDFPIAYAFDEGQLIKALEKLGATKEECVTLIGCGDIMKKADVPAFREMIKRHKEEIYELLQDEEKAMEAFLYEMDNHEYAINYDGDGDVLGCFGLEWEDLEKMGLTRAYAIARKRHMDKAREWM